MNDRQKALIISLIDFAWKQRAFDNPKDAGEIELLRQEILRKESHETQPSISG